MSLAVGEVHEESIDMSLVASMKIFWSHAKQ